MSSSWLNGQPTDSVAVSDRGLNYGDGVFTTIKVTAGRCEYLEAHFRRLRHSAEYLKLPGVDWPRLANEITTAINGIGDGVLKVMLTRAGGGRGYSCQGSRHTQRLLMLSTMPGHYRQWRSDGIDLGVCSLGLGLNPATAGIKHLNRLEQVLARQEIDEQGWQEGLLLDIDGCVVECNVANIFWRYDNQVFTPALHLAGVDGIMRQRVLTMLEQQQIEVEVERLPLDHLMMADEVWICNSLMGLVPVNRIGEQRFASREMSDKLQGLLEEQD